MVRLVSVILLLVLGAPPQAQAQAESPGVDDYLRQQQEDAGIPGLAVAVVRGSEVEHRFMAGTDGDGQEITDQTPFLLGSVSKSVTALAVLQLVDKGEVDLDEPAQRYVPDFRLASGAERITVRQLLDHTSGIPGDAVPTDSFGATIADLTEVEPSGTEYDYSDANYLVLGALVAEVSGQSFGDYLRENVLTPLDMRNAATSEDEAQEIGLPAGHRYYLGAPQRFESRLNTTGLPYGFLATSLEDLTHLASAQLDPASGMPAPQADLGWIESTMDGADLLWKAGSTPGYFAHVVLVPEQDLAVVVLANVYSPAMDAALVETGFNVVRVLNGESPQEVGVDPLLTTARILLIVAAVGLLAALVWSLLRRRPSRRPALVAWGVGCVLLAAGALLLPSAMGYGLSEVLLWTPDLGHAIIAVAVLAAALAVAKLWKSTGATH